MLHRTFNNECEERWEAQMAHARRCYTVLEIALGGSEAKMEIVLDKWLPASQADFRKLIKWIAADFGADEKKVELKNYIEHRLEKMGTPDGTWTTKKTREKEQLETEKAMLEKVM